MSNETNIENKELNSDQPAQREDSVDLTLQDLAAIKSMIDVASARGAFKPNEMIVVGTVYNKLEKFLEAAAKQAQEQNPNA